MMRFRKIPRTMARPARRRYPFSASPRCAHVVTRSLSNQLESRPFFLFFALFSSGELCAEPQAAEVVSGGPGDSALTLVHCPLGRPGRRLHLGASQRPQELVGCGPLAGRLERGRTLLFLRIGTFSTPWPRFSTALSGVFPSAPSALTPLRRALVV